jgi:hypothetical protein
MNIENRKKYFWSNVIDFLVVNFIIVLVFFYMDNILNFLFPSNTLYFMGIPKPYISFIEGVMVGILIGIYILLKKEVNMISIILGMWLLPVIKYSLLKPLYSLETWLIYLSELSMFIGIVCVLMSCSRILVRYISKNL